MSLTDTVCKNAKPKEKPYKLSDSGGLYLNVMPNGSKLWRLKYRFEGKEKLLALGKYPNISLAEARENREKAKKLVQQHIDPSDVKKDEQRQLLRGANNTFESVALEWFENSSEDWSPKYRQIITHRLTTDIFPYIGKKEISKLEALDVLDVLRKIEKRDALDLAGRCRQICSWVFRYGIFTGKNKHNPALDLLGALKTRKTKHYAAIEPKEIPELLEAVEQNDARLFNRTRRAIKLSMLTFVRPGELRQAKWHELDFEKKEWLIPAERMKSRTDHIVPLSTQAISILEEQKEETGHLNTSYVFPSQIKIKNPMSDGTVRLALHKLGFKDRMTAHGFRALARTAIREELDYEPDIIEAQLAHKPSGSLGAAYDRAKFIKKRHIMMQEWADYLDRVALESKSKVISVKFS